MTLDWIGLVVHDKAESRCVLAGATRTSAELRLGVSTPVLESPMAEVLVHKRRFYIPDLEKESRFPAHRRWARDMGFRSLCYLPLGWRDNQAGAIVIASRTAGAFDEPVLEFLELALSPAGLGLYSIAAAETLEAERDRLRTIAELDRAIMGGLSTESLFRNVAAALLAALPDTGFAIGIWNEETQRLELRMTVHPGKPPEFGSASWPVEGTPIGEAFRSGSMCRYADAEIASLAAPMVRIADELGFRFLCAAPLRAGNRTRGGMSLASRRPLQYDRFAASMLKDVSSHIALALHAAEIHEQLERRNRHLEVEKVQLEMEVASGSVLHGIVGTSAPIRELRSHLEAVAPSGATVLIQGETGTGKERVARAIHLASPRAQKPFVTLNCAAVPAGLLESELFGHEKGAFTGAVVQRAGRFELARGGTLFLDEIGEMPLDLQPKLLRVLQEREYERVGGTRSYAADVRIVAATNRDLKALSVQGRFREDLYYRLNVFPLRVPALRERRDDIPALAQLFCREFSDRYGKGITAISREAMDMLVHYSWPGNIRELQNVMERSVLLCDSELLTIPKGTFGQDPPAGGYSLTLEQAERRAILAALRESRGAIGGPSGAAARLGMKRTTLIYRMRKLNISRVEFLTRVSHSTAGV